MLSVSTRPARSMLKGSVLGTLLLALVLLLSACGDSTNTGNNQASCPNTTSLTGAGSTFDYPLFSKMFNEFARVGCNIEVNYQSVGSGAGKTQFLQQTVDFGATDGPMTDEELAKSTNGPILHIPVTIGSEAVSYNLSQVPADQHIKLTGATLADIFLGKVTFWDDPEITANNSGLSLPHQAITVVHRSDGSGTTAIFTQYLAAVSDTWKSQVGAGSTVNWPVGVGAQGNEAVATAVKNTPGAIGYNELAYVLSTSIQYAAMQDHDGDFVLPSLDTTKAAVANITTFPDDLRFYSVNEPGQNAYPISGFSWVVVYQNQKDSDKGRALALTLWWMVHDGQQYSSPLSYAPLPALIVQKDEAKIKAMQCGSSACYNG
jgi:phosphate transport system substrate-binding protein